MARSVEQSGSHLLGFGTFGEQHHRGLLAVHVGIQVEDLDGHFQVVEQGHNLDLVGLLVKGLHFCLAEVLDR